ncbi:exodeoxyribonuclease III [Fannyhessea vaginae]|uniref:exodeoxyribonuclease III n=1 Tax=Fannyhessea vaginae TaxID=82135 RepID=UPI003A8093CA
MSQKHPYRFVSWNVNGLRATLKKEPSFLEIFSTLNADIFAIQETKLQAGQVNLDLNGYTQTWSYAERKGYSGTAVFSREKPLSTIHTIGCKAADNEGRVCALEFEKFWFVDVYTPNSKNELARLDERMEWDKAYREFLVGLDAQKPVITCGDFNVAHQEIDLKNPASNHENAGFSDEEREGFSDLLGAGFTDTFRSAHPTLEGAYSWWSYRMRSRERNAGWRIDYFLVSNRIANTVTSSAIYNEIYGSDHCPVGLELEL